jgi:hypothetical protein
MNTLIVRVFVNRSRCITKAVKRFCLGGVPKQCSDASQEHASGQSLICSISLCSGVMHRVVPDDIATTFIKSCLPMRVGGGGAARVAVMGEDTHSIVGPIGEKPFEGNLRRSAPCQSQRLSVATLHSTPDQIRPLGRNEVLLHSKVQSLMVESVYQFLMLLISTCWLGERAADCRATRAVDARLARHAGAGGECEHPDLAREERAAEREVPHEGLRLCGNPNEVANPKPRGQSPSGVRRCLSHEGSRGHPPMRMWRQPFRFGETRHVHGRRAASLVVQGAPRLPNRFDDFVSVRSRESNRSEFLMQVIANGNHVEATS